MQARERSTSIATLRKVFADLGLTAEEFLQHEHTEGPFCLILRDVRRCKPVEIRGQQGLWDVPNSLLPQLEALPCHN